jgi:hypothetical protein
MSSRSSNEESAPFLRDPEAHSALKEGKGVAESVSIRRRVVEKFNAVSKPLLLLHVLLLFGNAVWSIINLQPKHTSRAGVTHPRGGLYGTRHYEKLIDFVLS